MPIYTYICNECNYKFEKYFKTIGGVKEVRCPKCDSDNVKKIIDPIRFVLKGSGWAKDGYSK